METSVAVSYIPVPVVSFMGGKFAHVDIHVQLGEGHYVKVIGKGDIFDLARLKNYKTFQDVLYIAHGDYGAHVEHCLSITKVALDDVRHPKSVKVKVLTKTMETVFAELQYAGLSESALSNAGEITAQVANAADSLNVHTLIANLDSVSESLTKHSIGVSILSIMIANAIGWKSRKTQNVLSMAGLLHDIGFRELPRGFYDLKRAEMTPEDIKVYETHPTRGAELLRDFPKVPAEVVAVVYDHHERPNGGGFPRNLHRERIFPMARCLALADQIAHMILESKRDPEPRSFAHALQYLELTYRYDWEPIYWQGLHKIASASEDGEN